MLKQKKGRFEDILSLSEATGNDRVCYLLCSKNFGDCFTIKLMSLDLSHVPLSIEGSAVCYLRLLPGDEMAFQ